MKVTWKNLQIVFATAKGKVRKNSLEDFSSINAAGKDCNETWILMTKSLVLKYVKNDQDI